MPIVLHNLMITYDLYFIKQNKLNTYILLTELTSFETKPYVYVRVYCIGFYSV